MRKFVLDSDCLIKLAKAGALYSLMEGAECFVPEEVFEEVVVVGKRLLYDDAEAISEMVKNCMIRVESVACKAHPSLGKGEVAAKELAKKISADAVLSDDQRFLSELESEGISFMNSAHAIVWLNETRSITHDQALMMIDQLRPFINKDSYQSAMTLIGGKKP